MKVQSVLSGTVVKSAAVATILTLQSGIAALLTEQRILIAQSGVSDAIERNSNRHKALHAGLTISTDDLQRCFTNYRVLNGFRDLSQVPCSTGLKPI